MIDNMPEHSDCFKERPCIFMKCLYEEKNIHKKHRFSLVQRKLLFIGALLGISSLHVLNVGCGIDSSNLVYLVPFMAIAYDIFILAEDYKVKRVGAFLFEKCLICQDEMKWEYFVKNNREPLAAYGTVLLTLLAFLAAAVILIFKSGKSIYDFDWWSIAPFTILMILYVIFYWILMESNKSVNKNK